MGNMSNMKNMNAMRAKKSLVFTFLLLAWGLLAIIFGKYDLAISNLFVNQSTTWAQKLKWLGVFVAPILLTYGGIIINVYYLRMSTIPCQCMRVIFSLLCIEYGLWNFVTTGLKFKDERTFALAIIFFISIGLLYICMAKMSMKHLRKMKAIGMTTILLVLIATSVIDIIKAEWGRMRYRDMINPDLEFTPWYLPQGFTGHRSFPSGHTAQASMLFTITMFANMVQNKLSKILCYLLPIICILVMAVSRVLLGAHFCSDVLFGMGITITLFYFIKYFVMKYNIE